MGFSYTEQQQSVIDVRGRNVLVSAAAGSGKTAVLVERIIQMVLRQEVSLDRLLVVTFTRAAASEMRERISEALNKALAENFRKEIRAQLALLPFADITTIHSFCLKVIRENYSLLHLEPDFQIVEESDAEILADAVMSNLLEEEYEKADADFIHLANSFSTGTGDTALESMIRQLYRVSQGMANPQKWLSTSTEQLKEMQTDPEGNRAVQALWQEVSHQLQYLDIQCRGLEDFTEDKTYAPFLEQSIFFREKINASQKLLKEKDFDGFWGLFREYMAPVLTRSRKGMDEQSVLEIKTRIENLRQGFEELSRYFKNNWQTNLEITANMHRILKELTRLVKEYNARFQAGKLEKQQIDFNDIEHLALQLLQTESGDASEIALRYRELYQEIIIDEYQDTNEVQDTILRLVSKAPEKPNSFMVGDIKQSIYKFRQAKPEIFREKYLTYGTMDSDYAKIDMQMNFRSRQEVLKLINYIFRSIMTEEAAGIDYDEKACFAFLEDKPLVESYRPKLLIIEKDSFQTEEETVDRETLEASQIATEIVELLESGKEIFDKKMGTHRPIQIEDIAILMRSPNSAMQTYADVFLSHGLPLLVEEGKAYFTTSEVRVLVDFLKMLDNPRDDMALLGVLTSTIFRMDPQDLAEIKVSTDDMGEIEFLFDRIKVFVDKMEMPLQTVEKAKYFIKVYEQLKERSYLLTLGELVEEIVRQTGYLFLVAMQSNGKQRSINVKSFVEQIKKFESKEGSSLFRFLQRLQKVQSLDLTFGEPVMEAVKAARILSIHKSKGLEFPVIFLAQMGKAFNIRDISSAIISKEEYGIFVSDVNYEKRFVREGFQKAVLKAALRKEILEEEQRLLYVALTRAREYLYMVGTVRKADTAASKWQVEGSGRYYRIDGFEGEICSLSYILSARSYLDFIMPALLEAQKLGLVDIKWHAVQDPVEELNLRPMKEQQNTEKQEKELVDQANLAQKEVSRSLREILSQDVDGKKPEAFFEPYPYQELITEKITTSVSEEKRAFADPENFEDTKMAEDWKGQKVGQKEERKELDSIQQEAIKRGILYHKIFALLPLGIKKEEVSEFLSDLQKKRMLGKDEREHIAEKHILNWLESPLWQRMVAAGTKGKLRREQPFIQAIPMVCGEIKESKMLQGIIDAFFEEDNELVLVDYKTDRIKGREADAGNILRSRYAYQLESYQKALEQITGKKVKESYIYSIEKNCCIRMF